MNERIKELEKQATETVRCGLNGASTAERFNRKKFAELIVRECISQIKKVQQTQTTIDPGTEYVQGFNDGMFVAVRAVEVHFGVQK